MEHRIMRLSLCIILGLLLAFGQATAACAGIAAPGDLHDASMADMQPADCPSGHACDEAGEHAQSADFCACGSGLVLSGRSMSSVVTTLTSASDDARGLPATVPGIMRAIQGSSHPTMIAYAVTAGIPLTLVRQRILLLI